MTPGRRCALLGASTAVVCLGGVLAACGGGGSGDGYVATGAAGGPPRMSVTAAAPTGEVTLVPLDEPESDGLTGGGSSNTPERQGSQKSAPPAAPGGGQRPAGSPGGPGSAATAPDAAAQPGSSPEPPASSTPSGSSTPSASSGSSGPSAPSAPASPAKLTVSDPVREPTDQRWCEKVTLDFHNSGGTAVRSGTVTFGTHVIGALGIDWATVESTRKLPAPIGAGKRKEQTWTVCVDAWHVPLGMHIETRDVTVRWE
ncbi:hypothetical protein [Streptomyces sp. AC550_RSS872]|uniref:hypothetical protein n=1 Tax=Streptomyces sp. AC550_RSS872 TaxID=2823689 RepID=UPI0020B6A436|nr:hypothetical protein [Streptomyces sp. AC550_RSS872]